MGLSTKALQLLGSALEIWSDVHLKFNFVEKLLQPVNEHPQLVITGLSILNIIAEHQLHKFIPENIPQIQTALLPCLQSQNTRVKERKNMVKTF